MQVKKSKPAPNKTKKTPSSASTKSAPSFPQRKANEINSANGAQTRPPEPAKPGQPANGAWQLTLDKTPPPNTPLVVLLPVSAPVPPSLSVTTDPQTLVLTQQNSVAAVLVRSQQTQENGTNAVPKPALQGAVPNEIEAPLALLCEKQQPHTLPQPCPNAAVIKAEPESPGYSEACMPLDFANVCDVPSELRVKEEVKEKFKFCKEKMATTLETEVKLKDAFKSSDLKTETEMEDSSLPPVINGSDDSENLEQSGLLISDVRSESLESSNLLITDLRRENTAVAICFESTGEQIEQVEKETTSQVPGHLDTPLDLRLNLNHSDECSEIVSQENMVTYVTQGHSQDTLEKKVTEESNFTTVEVDLREDHRDDLDDEGEGEPHECMTCGAIILDGDLIEHYMQHAMQGHNELTKSPHRPRSPTGSISSSSSYCPSASGFSTPNTSPPASPPSKRLRSRAK